METLWKVVNSLVVLFFIGLCNGLPINLENSGPDPHSQLLTGLVAVLLAVCSVVLLAGCLCCQRKNGFKEFRDSPVASSATIISSNLDHGHVNPIANSGSEFTIFTPISPPHHNNNVFLANQRIVSCNQEEYKDGDLDASSWFDGSEKDFPRTKLKYIRELGKGWFGRVVEGTAQNINEDAGDSEWTPVVVRILEASATSREKLLFLNDAAIYKCGYHPNILRIIGRSLDSVPLLLLQEYCSQGDVKKYLRMCKSSQDRLVAEDMPLQWCYQLTLALKFLHDQKLTHPDLAARNCQLSESLSLKLGDYGLSASYYPEDYYQGSPGVPLRWCAPEIISYTSTTIQTTPPTTEANVWALGITMWEILEWGEQPYSGLTDDEVISQVLGTPKVRLSRPTYHLIYTDYMYKIMQLCWYNSESRATVSQIELMMADLMHVYENTKISLEMTSDIPNGSEPISLQDFDSRWNTLKPNSATVEDSDVLEQLHPIQSQEQQDRTRKSASLNNLHGSLDNLLDTRQFDPMESWLENVASDTSDMSFVRGLSEAITDLDNAIAMENISSSSEFGKSKHTVGGQITSSESETEDENWRKKIERGAYTEKVRQKSRSVADLMILTHIDCSESDSETLPSLDFKANQRVRYLKSVDNQKKFGSEGNLLHVHDNTFQEELKKLQEERRDSLLFVPDKFSECSFSEEGVVATTSVMTPSTVSNNRLDSLENSPVKKLMEKLNSPSEMLPPQRVYNVFNVRVQHMNVSGTVCDKVGETMGQKYFEANSTDILDKETSFNAICDRQLESKIFEQNAVISQDKDSENQNNPFFVDTFNQNQNSDHHRNTDHIKTSFNLPENKQFFDNISNSDSFQNDFMNKADYENTKNYENTFIQTSETYPCKINNGNVKSDYIVNSTNEENQSFHQIKPIAKDLQDDKKIHPKTTITIGNKYFSSNEHLTRSDYLKENNFEVKIEILNEQNSTLSGSIQKSSEINTSKHLNNDFSCRENFVTSKENKNIKLKVPKLSEIIQRNAIDNKVQHHHGGSQDRASVITKNEENEKMIHQEVIDKDSGLNTPENSASLEKLYDDNEEILDVGSFDSDRSNEASNKGFLLTDISNEEEPTNKQEKEESSVMAYFKDKKDIDGETEISKLIDFCMKKEIRLICDLFLIHEKSNYSDNFTDLKLLEKLKINYDKEVKCNEVTIPCSTIENDVMKKCSYLNFNSEDRIKSFIQSEVYYSSILMEPKLNKKELHLEDYSKNISAAVTQDLILSKNIIMKEDTDDHYGNGSILSTSYPIQDIEIDQISGVKEAYIDTHNYLDENIRVNEVSETNSSFDINEIDNREKESQKINIVSNIVMEEIGKCNNTRHDIQKMVQDNQIEHIKASEEPLERTEQKEFIYDGTGVKQSTENECDVEEPVIDSKENVNILKDKLIPSEKINKADVQLTSNENSENERKYLNKNCDSSIFTINNSSPNGTLCRKENVDDSIQNSNDISNLHENEGKQTDIYRSFSDSEKINVTDKFYEDTVEKEEADIFISINEKELVNHKVNNVSSTLTQCPHDQNYWDGNEVEALLLNSNVDNSIKVINMTKSFLCNEIEYYGNKYQNMNCETKLNEKFLNYQLLAIPVSHDETANEKRIRNFEISNVELEDSTMLKEEIDQNVDQNISNNFEIRNAMLNNHKINDTTINITRLFLLNEIDSYIHNSQEIENDIKIYREQIHDFANDANEIENVINYTTEILNKETFNKLENEEAASEKLNSQRSLIELEDTLHNVNDNQFAEDMFVNSNIENQLKINFADINDVYFSLENQPVNYDEQSDNTQYTSNELKDFNKNEQEIDIVNTDALSSPIPEECSKKLSVNINDNSINKTSLFLRNEKKYVDTELILDSALIHGNDSKQLSQRNLLLNDTYCYVDEKHDDVCNELDHDKDNNEELLQHIKILANLNDTQPSKFTRGDAKDINNRINNNLKSEIEQTANFLRNEIENYINPERNVIAKEVSLSFHLSNSEFNQECFTTDGDSKANNKNEIRDIHFHQNIDETENGMTRNYCIDNSTLVQKNMGHDVGHGKSFGIESTSMFLKNEVENYIGTERKVDFDLSDTQDKISLNSLTHLSTFTSTPFANRRATESTVILGASDDYSIDYYSGLKTSVDPEENTDPILSSNFVRQNNNNDLYSLETWDNFLGRSFDEQESAAVDFNDFSQEPHSLLFLECDNNTESQTRDLMMTKILNETYNLEAATTTNETFIKEKKQEDVNATFDGGINKGSNQSEIDPWKNNENIGNSGGWFLHPQCNASIKNQDSGTAGTSEESYVGFSMDDEIMAAIRNELLTKLPHAQRASSDHQIEENGEEMDSAERNEVFLRYNVYNTPLSPIPEESCDSEAGSGRITPKRINDTSDDEGDSSDWSVQEDNNSSNAHTEEIISPRIPESPAIGRIDPHRHTPSQDSCCSNDTLFNVEELNGGINDKTILDQALKVPHPFDNPLDSMEDEDSRYDDCNADTYATENEGTPQNDVGEEKSPQVPVIKTEHNYILEFLNNERYGEMNLSIDAGDEISSTSDIYLTVSDNTFSFGQNVAPLNSPEDRPWKELQASFRDCDEGCEEQNSQKYTTHQCAADSEHILNDSTLEKQGPIETFETNQDERSQLFKTQNSPFSYHLGESEETDDCLISDEDIDKILQEELESEMNQKAEEKDSNDLITRDNTTIDHRIYVNLTKTESKESLNTEDSKDLNTKDDTNIDHRVYVNLTKTESGESFNTEDSSYNDSENNSNNIQQTEIEYENLKNYPCDEEDIYSKVEETEDSENKFSRFEDLFGPLTDIRFSGPGSSTQMMTTSFSESNDLGDDQDWDSGSDTRSSSSGEFIWKEGEHEASVKALRAPPQLENVDYVNPMGNIQEEEIVSVDSSKDNSSSASTSGSEGEDECPEFVPSAWDKYATPTKSALRSPEKTLERSKEEKVQDQRIQKEKKPKGVWFKKQKYHCVYEYPREPESPVLQSYDLWKPTPDYATLSDWDLDTDAYLPTELTESEISFENPSKHDHLPTNLYHLTTFSDVNIDPTILDEDFFVSSSSKPFDMLTGLTSQFFPGKQFSGDTWTATDNINITPDSGVEDIVTPASFTDDAVDSCGSKSGTNSQITKVQSLRVLAANAVERGGTRRELGGLRHTRNKLKLDLPPSPSAFSSNRTFSIESVADEIVTRQVPTFTTFGKSRFLVQHVDTPPDSGRADKNVSFEALPHKKPEPQTFFKEIDDWKQQKKEKHKIESVRGEASLLDSADEDSGIESCTLDRKKINV